MRLRRMACTGLALMLLCMGVSVSHAAGKASTPAEFAAALEDNAAELKTHFSVSCSRSLIKQLEQKSDYSPDGTLLSDIRSMTGSCGACSYTLYDNKIVFDDISYYAGWRILCLWRSGKTGQLNAREQETLDAALEIVGGARGTDLEKERYIYDALCARITYETLDTVSGDNDCAIGALLNGRADCDGYADAMVLCCGLAGIPCRYMHGDSREAVPGSAQDGSHMWNLVCINGLWLMTDATWGDREQTVSYLFFNLGQKDALEMYIWNPEAVFQGIAWETDFSAHKMADQQPVTVASQEDVYRAARAAALAGVNRLLLFSPGERPWETDRDTFLSMLHHGAVTSFSYRECGRLYELTDIEYPAAFRFCDTGEQVLAAIHDYAVSGTTEFSLYFEPALAVRLFADEHSGLIGLLSRSEMKTSQGYRYSEKDGMISLTDVSFGGASPYCASEEDVLALIRRELPGRPSAVSFVLADGLSAESMVESAVTEAYSLGAESISYSAYGKRVTLTITAYFGNYCLAGSEDEALTFLRDSRKQGKDEARIYCTDELYALLNRDNAKELFALLDKAGFTRYSVYYNDTYRMLGAKDLR